MHPKSANDLVVANPVSQDDFDEQLKQLPSEWQPTCKKLRKKLREVEGDLYLNFYEVGVLLDEELRQIADRNESSYGLSIVGTLARVLKMNSRALHNYLKVARMYEREEFKSLIEGGVTWTHFVYLTSIADKKERKCLEMRVVGERLPVAALAREVQLIEDDHEVEAAATRPATPGNISKALDRLQHKSKMFYDLLDVELFGENFDLPRALLNTVPDAWTQELCNQIEVDTVMLADLEKNVGNYAAALRETLERGKTILAKRAAMKESSAPDEARPPVLESSGAEKLLVFATATTSVPGKSKVQPKDFGSKPDAKGAPKPPAKTAIPTTRKFEHARVATGERRPRVACGPSRP
jgi:hypothetical protein